MTSNFPFLLPEWSDLHEAALKAERLALSDPRASCFYTRRALEIGIKWLYQHDGTLRLPYQDHLSALIFEPTFREAVGSAVFYKVRVIKDLGNLAVHSRRPIQQLDAVNAVRELFHFTFWIARTYARGAKPPDGLTFKQELLPRDTAAAPQTLARLQQLDAELAARDTKLSEVLSAHAALSTELEALRAELAVAKAANSAAPDAHDYSEAETRDYFIDLLLKEAGWPLDQKRDREFEVAGMPNNEGVGFVDYVLWGTDGKPLALVEAKRTRRDARVGQQQARLYADCLESKFGRRPVIYYSNGYEHWLWDDAQHPPRSVQGFMKLDELELLVQRRTTRTSRLDTDVDGTIVERFYQTRAIKRIAESFERDHQRKALLVMATGAGKTRTVIALAELLMRCNWAKRVLFLADRVALVNQAVSAFKRHLPSSAPVNLVTDKDTEGRVYVSTYATMMGLIDESNDGQRRFGVGHFDLVVIDEAHRSVYQKYRAIFDYFDSYLVGLTATPKDEVDRNTYSLFELETGVPTDVYSLEEAVHDRFLVPPQAISVPLKFQRDGIRYDELSEAEKDEWDALEWDDDGDVPDRVEAEAVNRWLFNADTVDKVLAHVMTNGLKVAGGDRLGKTIVFAKNHDHAAFIAQRFDANYPHLKGVFARVIDYQTEYAQSLIDSFSNAEKSPHIAVSVDMLDTGIDIPEVVNLVFFKLVRSKTKFWQMIGRGTRLRPDLFGPGRHKQYFCLFDFCQNLEYFNQNLPVKDGAAGESLGRKLFTTRLQLVAGLDRLPAEAGVVREGDGALAALRGGVVALLHAEVAGMSLDNFIVRPQRRWVERFAKSDAWQALGDEDIADLSSHVAGLPTSLVDDDELAKRFDLILLRLQLCVLANAPGFKRLSVQVREIAALLLEKVNIPMVRDQLPLLEEVSGEPWWEDVTVVLLEQARRRLRGLVKFLEKSHRATVYTDFEDEIGAATAMALPGLGGGAGFELFRVKALAFLREHQDHIAIHRLRMNEPLTPTDLAELERMLVAAGVGTPDDLARAKETSKGLGLFIRSLVGLDREAAKRAFAAFFDGRPTTANQIEFVNVIINHLTQHGVMEPGLLWESPFTDLHSHGPDGVFTPTQVEQLVATLREVEAHAAG